MTSSFGIFFSWVFFFFFLPNKIHQIGQSFQLLELCVRIKWIRHPPPPPIWKKSKHYESLANNVNDYKSHTHLPDNKTHLQHGQNVIRQSKWGRLWGTGDSNIRANSSKILSNEAKKKTTRRKKTHNKFEINARQISMLIHSNVPHISFDDEIEPWQRMRRQKKKKTNFKRNSAISLIVYFLTFSAPIVHQLQIRLLFAHATQKINITPCSYIFFVQFFSLLLPSSIDGSKCDTLFIRIIAYELYSMIKWALINLQLALFAYEKSVFFLGVWTTLSYWVSSIDCIHLMFSRDIFHCITIHCFHWTGPGRNISVDDWYKFFIRWKDIWKWPLSIWWISSHDLFPLQRISNISKSTSTLSIMLKLFVFSKICIFFDS